MKKITIFTYWIEPFDDDNPYYDDDGDVRDALFERLVDLDLLKDGEDEKFEDGMEYGWGITENTLNVS